MKRTEPVGILDGRMITATWDVTPAPGAVVDDLGHGVTVVLRDPPPPRAWLPAGRVWIAPYALNCAEHGWRVSRRTAEECAAEGREHIARDHGGDSDPLESCPACGRPAITRFADGSVMPHDRHGDATPPSAGRPARCFGA